MGQKGLGINLQKTKGVGCGLPGPARSLDKVALATGLQVTAIRGHRATAATHMHLPPELAGLWDERDWGEVS